MGLALLLGLGAVGAPPRIDVASRFAQTAPFAAQEQQLDEPVRRALLGRGCHGSERPLADRLPSLPQLVWVGVSAGSMVMTPRIGNDFVTWPPARDDRTRGVVDFSSFPHLGHEMMPENTLAEARRWAIEIAGPAFAIHDQTAIQVTDGTVEVISEGQWERLVEG